MAKGRSNSDITQQQVDDHRAAVAVREAERKAARKLRSRVCKHRGKKTGAADSWGPRGVDCCALFACALHGQCSVKRAIPGVAVCAKCPDYEAKPKGRQPDPDDGRSG
jgi:hypothetical protein